MFPAQNICKKTWTLAVCVQLYKVHTIHFTATQLSNVKVLTDSLTISYNLPSQEFGCIFSEVGFSQVLKRCT
jgi:hypothetical protein